ncbi:N5-glutamine methyltransferase family protein [Microvirga sp. 2TAF3]|uniref:N5-glutamine methyltransferase family protein n=1 Tax=Microvirga sp. 2TAF3 TaxID=3233014 RepID=UPI003F9CB927
MEPSEIATRATRFMGIEIEVSPDALVPREETELLGWSAVEILRQSPAERRAIDMCCGSGNLACATAIMVEDLTVWASDLTNGAVALARANVERLGLAGKVHVYQGDLFTPLDLKELGERVDLVICNPPYISTSRLEGDRSYLLQNEPREAFDGGPYGLSIHQRVIRDALPYLKPGGWIAFEFGEGQERQLAALLKRSGGYRDPEFRQDTQGIPRVMLAQKTF